MKQDFWEILQSAPEGYLQQKLIFGEQGEAIDFIFLEINPALFKSLGLRREQIQGKKASEILPPNIKEIWLKNIGKVFSEGEAVRFEVSFDGKEKFFEVISWSKEQGIVHSLFRDITQRASEKKTVNEFLQINGEETINSLETFDYKMLADRLRKFTGASLVFISLFDPERKKVSIGEVSGTGKEIEQIGDNILEQIKGKEWDCPGHKDGIGKEKKLVLWDSPEEMCKDIPIEEPVHLFSQKIEVGKAGAIEVNLPEGKRACFILFFPPEATEPTEEVIEKFVAQLDFFLKKIQVNETYREKEEKYQLIFENSPVGILHFDGEGVITACNEKFIELIGSSKEALLGLNMLKLPDKEVVAAVEEALAGRIGRYEGDYESTTADKVTPVQGIFTPVGSSRLGGGIGIVEDLSKRVEAERALTEREKKLQTLIDTAPIGIGVSADGVIKECNEKLCSIVGYAREELIGQEPRMLYQTEEESERVRREKLEQARSRGRWTLETVFQKKDGTLIDVLLNSAFLYPEDPPAGFIFTVMDVTDIKEAEREKESAYSILEALFKNSPNPITICTQDSYVFVTPSTAELIGKSPEEVEGKKFSEVLPPGVELQFKKNLEKVSKLGEAISLKEMVPTTKGERFYETWLFPVKNPVEGEKLFGALSIDITKRQKHEEKLDYLSYHDTLTGLKNRAFLEEKIDGPSKNGDLPLSIIIADINGLKLVNDAYGHKMGDRILVRVARVLEENSREKDILCRWGGDEFVILLPQTKKSEAEEVGRKFKEACNREYINGLPISISWGTGEKLDREKAIEKVLKDAEDQMYRHKLSENRSARSAVLSAMLKTLGVKSDETEEHAWRLKKMAWKVGEKVNLSLSERERLTLLVSMHDIGKISITSEILNKPGKLTAEEWEEIKRHPETGFHIANSTGEFAHIAEEILSHHERWDGNGYPRGLRGTNIPLLARILSIVDAYDVMVNGRPYKKPMTGEEAIAELNRCAGTQFDPDLVRIFVDLIERGEFSSG